MFTVYVDDGTLIPKNTSLLVARVPLSQQPKKQWEGSNSNASSVQKMSLLARAWQICLAWKVASRTKLML